MYLWEKQQHTYVLVVVRRVIVFFICICCSLGVHALDKDSNNQIKRVLFSFSLVFPISFQHCCCCCCRCYCCCFFICCCFKCNLSVSFLIFYRFILNHTLRKSSIVDLCAKWIYEVAPIELMRYLHASVHALYFFLPLLSFLDSFVFGWWLYFCFSLSPAAFSLSSSLLLHEFWMQHCLTCIFAISHHSICTRPHYSAHSHYIRIVISQRVKCNSSR